MKTNQTSQLYTMTKVYILDKINNVSFPESTFSKNPFSMSALKYL